MIIVDAHEDLAWNMLTFGRDYTRSVAETRTEERGNLAPKVNGDTLLGWPEYQRARVAVVFATLFAAPERRRNGEWDQLCYSDSDQAYERYLSQIEIYERLAGEHPDKFILVGSQDDLSSVISGWEDEDQESVVDGHPVGLVPLMEGAEGLRELSDLEWWWSMGVRLIGPAWAGNRFCGGTREPGGLTEEGVRLLEVMGSLGYGLDLSHMDEPAALTALDIYPGVLMASHSNALALLKGSDSNRHLSDRVIRGLLERGGVIGIVPLNTFLQEGWKRGDSRDTVSLQHVAAQIDYVCQIAGDALHVGIGTDFDGGFGLQSVPVELDSVADLVKLKPVLGEMGYSTTDITNILGENWLRLLGRVLPGAS